MDKLHIPYNPDWVRSMCAAYGSKHNLYFISIDWEYRKLSWYQKYKYKKMWNKCKKDFKEKFIVRFVDYQQLIHIATHFYIASYDNNVTKYTIYDSTKDLFYKCDSNWGKI